jgi:hypothetical protein
LAGVHNTYVIVTDTQVNFRVVETIGKSVAGIFENADHFRVGILQD